MEMLFKECQVCLNEGVDNELETKLKSVFPEALCSMRIEWDMDDEPILSPTLYINLDCCAYATGRDDTNLMMICIDGYENIDGLRRYCEMVLAQSERIENRLATEE